MTIIVELIVALLKAFFPSMKEASQDTYIQAEKDESLEKRLRDKVNAAWGKSMIFLCLSLALVGCGTRTIYVPDGQPVKLRESLKGVKIWVKDKDGNTIATYMDIPEGWFVLPDSED